MDRTLLSLSSQQQRHHSRQRSVSLTSNHDDAAPSALALSSPPSPVSKSHSPISNRRLSTVSRRPTTYQNIPRESHLTRKPVGSGCSRTGRQTFGNANTKGQRRPRFLRNWWMEIGACLLFMIAFVAIIATLYPHQGKPLPEWPFQISINALVSVYVVVLKTTIVFVTAEGLGQLKWRWFRKDRPLDDVAQYDSASRGPLGSTTLLWRLGLRHPLASCGALITIVMLVIDPFAQQIIRYRNCDVPIDGGVATVARTNYYQGHGSLVGIEETTEPALQAAINAGIFSPGNLVSRSCLTGNCSFPGQYSSLGFCSSCSDATVDLSTHYYQGDDSDEMNSIVNVSLPSGSCLLQSYNPRNLSTWDVSSLSESIVNVVDFIVAEDAFDIDQAQRKLIFRDDEQFAPGCAPDNSSWYCRGYGAARCAMGPCVKTYTASFTVGNFQEAVVEESPVDLWGLATIDSNPLPIYATVDTHCINDNEKSELEIANYIIDPQERWLPYNITFFPTDISNDSFPFSLLLHKCLYAIDYPFVSGLWEYYLGNIFFTGTVQGAFGAAVNDRYIGPQSLLQVYDYGNVSLESLNSTFQNISQSITTYMRETGNANHSEPAGGNVLRGETCLEVHWGWLALPAALVVLTLLFFIVMIIQTRPTGNRAQIWKSSPLALIYHGLEPNNAHQDGLFLDDIKEMENVAKTMRVKLGITTNGVKFVETQGSGEKYTPQEHG